MKINQSAAVLALFLSSTSTVSGVKTKSEEDSPFLIFSRNNWDGAPSRFNSMGSTFRQMADEESQDDEQVVPIALALKRRGNHHQRRYVQPQAEVVPMFSQPSDFMSQDQDGPGVVFMRERQPRQQQVVMNDYQPSDFQSQNGPGVVFMRERQPSIYENPTVFMVAEKPSIEFQRPGEQGSTEIKDLPPKKEKEIPAKPSPNKMQKRSNRDDEQVFQDAPFPDVFSHQSNPMSNMMHDMERDMQRMVRQMHDGFSHDFGGFGGSYDDPWNSFERRASQPQPQKKDKKEEKPKETENKKNLTGLNKNDRKESEKTKIEKAQTEPKDKNKTKEAKEEKPAEKEKNETKEAKEVKPAEKPEKKERAIDSEKEYVSKEFSNAETTTDCDRKSGICIVEKCINGDCQKFTQYTNGTRIQTDQKSDSDLKKPEKKTEIKPKKLTTELSANKNKKNTTVVA